MRTPACANCRQRHCRTESCLLHASKIGDYELVTALVNAKATIEQGNICGTTPLHMACQRGHLSVARYLLAQGANAENVNAKSRTPLISACTRRHPELVRWLLRSGANIWRVMDLPELYAGAEGQHRTALWHTLDDYTQLCAACAKAERRGIIEGLLPAASIGQLQQAKAHAQDEGQYEVATFIQHICDAGSYKSYRIGLHIALARLRDLVVKRRATVCPDAQIWVGSGIAVATVETRFDFERGMATLLFSIFDLPDQAFGRVIQFYTPL